MLTILVALRSLEMYGWVETTHRSGRKTTAYIPALWDALRRERKSNRHKRIIQAAMRKG